MTVTPTSRTVHAMPHQIAYTDASLAVQDVYALAAVVNGVTVTATARAHTTQQAELQAARLAVQHADPGPLHLHVDCLATVHVLTGLARSKSPLTEPAQQLLQLAAERGVALVATRRPSRFVCRRRCPTRVSASCHGPCSPRKRAA